MNAQKIEEPKLVESAFLPNGDQICIWSDGVATRVNKDKGDELIGIRKARRLIAETRRTDGQE